MVADAAEPGARNRVMRDAGMAVRGDDEVGAGRNGVDRHEMRVLVHIDVDAGGTRAFGQPVVGGRDRDTRDL
jgi:hypothetical protein